MGKQAVANRPDTHDQPVMRPGERSHPLIDFAALCGVTRMAQIDERGNQRMMREVEERASALAGPTPSPLLRSLALTVALCEHDVRLRQSMAGPLTNDEPRQRNLDRAIRRYLAACKTLAAVRRLDRPTVQLNVAQNQIVATSGISAAQDLRPPAPPEVPHDAVGHARQSGLARRGATPRRKGITRKGPAGS